MKREGGKQPLGKVYREFSRQRYNRYKHQYPRMRESELVLKIIKEWEMLDSPRKKTLSEKYSANKLFADDDDNSCHSTAKKAPPKRPEMLLTTPQTKHESRPVASYPPLFPYNRDQDMDSEFHRQSERYSEDLRSESSSYCAVVAKEEEPKSLSYISFYNYHYSRLLKEHQGWKASQITQIIKLLWKRRIRLVKKMETIKQKKVKIIRRNMTGRKFFINLKLRDGLSRQVLLPMWKRFPRETRNMYKLRGKGEPALPDKNSLINLRKFAPENNLSFIKTSVKS